MAIILPKGVTAWPQERAGEAWRVEYIARDGAVDRVDASLLCVAYFDDAAAASSFADANTTWGNVASTVEARDLPVTHEVHSLAVDSDYCFSIKRFGDLDTALLEFNVGRVRARKTGGRYELRAVGVEKPILAFSRKVD